MRTAVSLHRLLGDETRLRLLRVLASEQLNVTELTGVLGLAQSGVSRHLGLLKDAGLVSERREGGFSYYHLAPEVRSERDGFGHLWPLLEAEFRAAAADSTVREDEARLKEILRLRKENFETHGADRQLVPGRSWAAWARALGHLLPPLVVADIGCGEGYLTIEMARWAKRVIGIDRSDEVLRRARALADRRKVCNISWRRGEIERVPLRDRSVDVVLLSQALHHAAQPARAFREAARILRPGGRALVLDLRTHDQAWVRDRLGDRWLGFDDDTMATLLGDAGFRHVRLQVGVRAKGDPFTVVIASGERSNRNRIDSHSHA